MNLKKIFDIATIKFMAVGVINTLVGMGAMFIMFNVFRTDYWVANISNVVLGSIVSYFLNKYFTFKSKEKSLKEVLIFALNIAVCHFLAYGVAKPLVNLVLKGLGEQLTTNIAMLVGAGLFVVLNYFGQRFIVFKYKRDEK